MSDLQSVGRPKPRCGDRPFLPTTLPRLSPPALTLFCRFLPLQRRRSRQPSAAAADQWWGMVDSRVGSVQQQSTLVHLFFLPRPSLLFRQSILPPILLPLHFHSHCVTHISCFCIQGKKIHFLKPNYHIITIISVHQYVDHPKRENCNLHFIPIFCIFNRIFPTTSISNSN